MSAPLFTIGHSNRSLDDFVAMLKGAGVVHVADVRKLPASRANPQFNAEPLAEGLAAHQIGYGQIAELGGLRGKRAAIDPALNGNWQNRSFHNYADYALSAEFRTGLRHLLEIAEVRRVAMMCSEAVWWRCHRRIVSDYALAAGREVFHIMGVGRIEPARLTQGARVGADGSVTYPAAG